MNNANTIAIGNNFNALRTGEFVARSINEEKGEFLLNEDSDLPVATLKEIASKNSIDLAGIKKKGDVQSHIISTLINERNLPTMDEKPQDEIALDIVKQGHEANHDDDTILVNLVQAGIKFSAAGRLFREAQTKLGLRLTPDDKREYVTNTLGDDFTPTTADELSTMIDKVAQHDAISPAQARAAVRKYLKDNEREIPKLVNAATTGGIRGKIFDLFTANPAIDEAGFASEMEDIQPDAEKRDLLIRNYTSTRLLVNRVASKVAGD
jgi:hypothetical protein